MNNFCFLLLIIFLRVVCPNDVVINSTDTSIPLWSSVTFTMPVELPFINPFSNFCKLHDFYYCLNSFEVHFANQHLPAFEVVHYYNNYYIRGVAGPIQQLKRSAVKQCQDEFEAEYKQHNYFVFGESCCHGQYISYFRSVADFLRGEACFFSVKTELLFC